MFASFVAWMKPSLSKVGGRYPSAGDAFHLVSCTKWYMNVDSVMSPVNCAYGFDSAAPVVNILQLSSIIKAQGAHECDACRCRLTKRRN